MTTKPHDDDTQKSDPFVLQSDDDKKDDKKAKKSKYTEDVNDPNYVEPRLREGWTPDQPG